MGRVNLFEFCNSISVEEFKPIDASAVQLYVKGKATTKIDLVELVWQFTPERIKKHQLDARSQNANLGIDPIVVWRGSGGTLYTLDGYLKAYLAYKQGKSTIQAILLTDKDIAALRNG